MVKKLSEILVKEEIKHNPYLRYFLSCNLEDNVQLTGQDFLCTNQEPCFHKYSYMNKNYCNYIKKKVDKYHGN